MYEPSLIANDELTVQRKNKIADLAKAYDLADNILNKKYLAELGDYQVVPIKNVAPALARTDPSDSVRIFHIDRIIFDKDENNQEKLLNVYSALHGCGGSVILLIQSKKKYVDFYLGTRYIDKNLNQDFDGDILAQDILQNAMLGNFPGSNMDNQKAGDIAEILGNIFDDKPISQTVAAVTSSASFREGHTMKSEDFVQGFEKLLETAYGKEFALMVVANPISSDEIAMIRNGYEQLYTQLSPFAKAELNFGTNESQAVTDSITDSVSEGVTKSIALTESHSTAKGRNWSTAKTTGTSHTEGTSKSYEIIGGLNFGSNKSDISSESTTNTYGGNETNSYSTGRNVSDGTSRQNTHATGTANTATTGSSKNRTLHFENRSVKSLLDRIDKQLIRLDACADIGMWDSAAYVIADDANTANLVASNYRALIRGKNAGLENSAITVWQQNSENFDLLKPYLQRMIHPVLRKFDSPVSVTPAAMLSTEELTIAAGLPQKSLPGILTDVHASFGREVITFGQRSSRTLKLGHIYHMGTARDIPVELDIDNLTAHTFITGSTGAGKSNAIYKILQNLKRAGVPWLVVEPAKGEYKNVFGGMKDVTTYGTNPYKTPNLLQINPFSFPDDIHVLEHVDRLTEIFNACWPMYAAMPAILHEAIEKAYESCGWNLKLSKNPGQFPTFATLLKILPQVIESSAYSADTAGDYTGALVTRVRSLTRGIQGEIFGEEISFGKLLSAPAIIDLSRVGAQETKSLLMGILVLKLQEFRMSEDTPANNALRHVTVLEEAHNLLKKTSIEQSQESSNLQGQAVVMLSNAIAEMRTYGEGFIIADQSPVLLDTSVIRNTNTKIILRLPEKNDRDIAGSSAGLSAVQIDELAKLDKGVAAVFQNDWSEPVLCKIDFFNNAHGLADRYQTETFYWEDRELSALKKFLETAMELRKNPFSDAEKKIIRAWYTKQALPEKVIYFFEKVLATQSLVDKSKKIIVLNRLLDKCLDQEIPEDEIVDNVKKLLQARFNFSPNSKVVEQAEKLFRDRELIS